MPRGDGSEDGEQRCEEALPLELRVEVGIQGTDLHHGFRDRHA